MAAVGTSTPSQDAEKAASLVVASLRGSMDCREYERLFARMTVLNG